MYPVNFPGLGRGLDFLLPSFLVSRQEKKVMRIEKTPLFGINPSFPTGNVWGAYAIRPYPGTSHLFF